MSDASWAADIGIGRILREWGQHVGLEPNLARQAVTIGFHADGVSYSTSVRVGYNRSMNVAIWNIASAEEQAYHGRRHLFYAVCKTSLCDCGCEGTCN